MYIKPRVVEEKIIERRVLFACTLNDELCEMEGELLTKGSEG